MKLPKGRSIAEFGDLSEAEEALLTACERGEVARIGAKCPESAQPPNTVRADFVAFLALGGDDNALVHYRGVQLQGAWIEGDLDLSGATVQFNLTLLNCRFAGAAPKMSGTNFNGSLLLSGSETKGLDLSGAIVRGSVFLNDDFKATGKVWMQGAQLGGNFECSGAQLDSGRENSALSMDHAIVRGSVIFRGVNASGTVWLMGLRLEGSFECGGARLDGGQGGDALLMHRAVIQGDVFLNGGFKANGRITLLGVRLGANLDCRGAHLDGGQRGDALSMDGSEVRGALYLNEGFKASGGVRLLGVQLGGALYCVGAQLNGGQDGYALAMDSAVIKGDVRLDDDFMARGEVLLRGAQVGGNLNCSGAHFEARPGHFALSMDGAVIKGDVSLVDDFMARGGVLLQGTQVGGNLRCSGAHFEASPGHFALSMQGAQVAGFWFLRGLKGPLVGVNLIGCRVERLVDEPESWGGDLWLDGFVYERLAEGSLPDRIGWLRKQAIRGLGSKVDNSGFKPQPWLQLQEVLREMGHLEDARQVAIALEDHRRAIGLVGQTPVAWHRWRRTAYAKTSVFLHWAFKMLIGYGYRPLRLVGWMFVVWAFSAGVFWIAALQGVMGPSNPLVFNDPELRKACVNNWYLCSDLPEEYTGFSPLAYSLDVLLPLVNLEQEKDWAPLIPTPKPSWWQEWLTNWSFKHLARLVVWAEILFGWIASLLLVAVFSGLTKRRED